MSNIRIGKTGRIIRGANSGSFVKILDDGDNTGGYLILFAKDSTFLNGYDDWVESSKDLEKYFWEAGLEVDWNYADMVHELKN